MPRQVKVPRQADELDLTAFTDELVSRIGPVSVILEVADDGTAVLDVLHPTENVEVPITAAEVAELAAVFVAPEPPPDAVDALDALTASLTGTRTLTDVQAALLTFAGAERARQVRERPGRPTLPDRSAR